MAVFTAATAFAVHAPFADPSQMTDFLKNLAISGGMLHVSAYAAGDFALDGRPPGRFDFMGSLAPHHPAEKRGRLRLIISPNGRDDSLRIRQDTSVYAGLFDGEESTSLTLEKNRHAYVHVARGSIDLNGVQLEAGDGVRLRNPETLQLSSGKDAEVLVFDLRPLELPQMP